MFTLNPGLCIERVNEPVPLIIIDDFLLNPYRVVKHLFQNIPQTLWKYWDSPSYNGKYFLDKRHFLNDPSIPNYYQIIQQLSGKNIKPTKNTLLYSNFTSFIDKGFNQFESCYWYPHVDEGYNAILYLNEDGCDGTNIYENLGDDYHGPEHYHCWRPKEKYKLLTNIKSKFNRLVIFDGKKYFHGMAVNSDRFFFKERINVVAFFTSENEY